MLWSSVLKLTFFCYILFSDQLSRNRDQQLIKTASKYEKEQSKQKVDENEIKFNDFMLKMNKNTKTKKPNLNRYRMQFLEKQSWTLGTSKGLYQPLKQKRKKKTKEPEINTKTEKTNSKKSK